MKRKLIIILVVGGASILFFINAIGAPLNDLTRKKPNTIEEERLAIEKTKNLADANIENRKLEIEKTKLEVEKSTARWTAMSSIIPLVVALSTLAFSIWSFRQQGSHEVELKAAEFAFLGKTPEAVLNRCKALKQIFGDRLPKDFGASFNPLDHGGGKEDSESKKFFIELLLKYPQQRSDIIQFWGALFGDAWLDRLKPLLSTEIIGAQPASNEKQNPSSK